MQAVNSGADPDRGADVLVPEVKVKCLKSTSLHSLPGDAFTLNMKKWFFF